MYTLPEEYQGKHLYTIDCCCEPDQSIYLENGETKIVSSPIGCYREACEHAYSRFGYRFDIENIGKPHMIVINYPDDKRRYMCVSDGTSYDLTTGIYTGVVYPLSNSMKQINNVFWPRWKECSVLFMTWGEGEPAAVQGFSIYELDNLPKAELPAATMQNRRSFGMQYEDPCGKGSSEGAKTFDEWLSRHIDYAHHTAQNRLVYPINWYHGPQFPSETQPSDNFSVVITEDRKQYVCSTTHPSDWLTALLKRFDEENLEFVGSMTLMRLGNLLQNMNIDIESIRQGKETYNNMLWNDQVQSSCGDWTTIYNVRNYKEYVRWSEENKNLSEFPWAYGEKPVKFHAGPMFNPLHPEVQRQILEYIKEIGDKYGKYKSFKGIAINMWQVTILWFGSLHAGYDDYTIKLFETETGISTGVDISDPNRFSKRYEYLTFKCCPAWVEWRCKKITELICKIRDALRINNPSLELTLTFWNETSKLYIVGMPSATGQLCARLNDYEFFREAGADLLQLGKLDGVHIAVETNSTRDRGYDSKGINMPLERGFIFRDHDFLDKSRNDTLHNSILPDAFTFDCWVEAWGKHKWFSCEPDDRNIPELSKIYDGHVELIHRINSYYPDDGFWWDSQSRITAAFPTGDHYKEYFVHAVAEYDALNITRGGLYMDKAHSLEKMSFAKAFRALPEKKFLTVGKSIDPVAVRKLTEDGVLYFYIVNREPYEISVTMNFRSDVGCVTDMSNLTAKECGKNLSFFLAPYDLKVFSAGRSAEITGFSLDIDPKITETIKRQAEEQLMAFQKVWDAGQFIPGMDSMEDEIKNALNSKRYSWLRHAFTSYIGCKARKIAGMEVFV